MVYVSLRRFSHYGDHLVPRALQTAHHHFAHPLEQLVAERRVLIAGTRAELGRRKRSPPSARRRGL